ncbi:NAD(P)/FAD-dependent oxidoreductase [Alicyclobacillus sp. ALC3]|uniref:NAD(P)/FAD-dependent oxidoreductase n=1 Tax=Alicyclobacillus sp. ALC3 TaxID=2796143 RepID=UPI0023781403|nr:FAD-dependent oxidoreductase [Alicyclobacillus sp. ALC3]WDL98545.1 FAD-dependent oxidoreductase [Alicyclobacillus sp. ALC3]
MTLTVDAVIIGAGPAGLSAAVEIARTGLSAAVIDEYPYPGGRLLGQLFEDPYAPEQDKVWDGKKLARRLEEEARNLNVKIFCGVTAWSASGKWRIHLRGSSEKYIDAKAILLATGAVERAVPLPGWTLPGVVSIGAAQVFTNVHRVSIGQRVMVVGVDPLAISVALEMQRAGINVVGVALPPVHPINSGLGLPIDGMRRLASVSSLATSSFHRKMGPLAAGKLSKLAIHALRFNLLHLEGIPIYLRKAVIAIKGTDVVEAVILQRVSINGIPNGPSEHVAVDSVCLSGGLYPLVDFAQVVGCPLVRIPELGGVVPLHGPDLSTPVDSLFVAGNIVGIESGKVAMAQGRLAGVAISRFLGKRTSLTLEEAEQNVQKTRDHSSFKFLPNIDIGNAKMNELWESHSAISTFMSMS